jgi:hypothetical protein
VAKHGQRCSHFVDGRRVFVIKSDELKNKLIVLKNLFG